MDVAQEGPFLVVLGRLFNHTPRVWQDFIEHLERHRLFDCALPRVTVINNILKNYNGTMAEDTGGDTFLEFLSYEDYMAWVMAYGL